MFFITSKILSFLINPIFWFFSLLISSIIFKTKRKKILYITLFLFYLFTNNFIADRLAMIWEISPKSISSLEKKYKYGIVLGGYSSYNKAVQHIDLNNLGDRIISAIELYRLNKIEKIIISGGNGKLFNNGIKESDWSKKFLINMGVHRKDILLDSISRNTIENAQYTARLIKKDISKESLLITSGNHMRRASFCFIKNNINIETYPTDCTITNIPLTFDYLFIPNIQALKKWESLIHECIGYITYRIIF